MESLRWARQCFSSGEDQKSTQQEHLRRIAAEHREIYAAIKQRDVEEADALASRHSELFRERLSQQILGVSVQKGAQCENRREDGARTEGGAGAQVTLMIAVVIRTDGETL